MRPRTARFPTLERLLAGYFHQDWRLEAANSREVVNTMIEREARDVLNAAIVELDILLDRDLCEPQLRDIILYELGTYVDPEAERRDMSSWLQEFRAWIKSATIGS